MGSTNVVGDESYFDKQLTVFSPEGKLLQYAFNAVSNCSFTSLGLRTEEGAVLISHKNITSKMIDPDYIKHVKPVTERLGCAYAGHIPDCEYMHLNAIHESVKFFDKYGHGFDIVALTRRLNAINQVNTQSPRMRILAASLLIIGIEMKDSGEKVATLSKIDPAGFEASMNAFAIGKHQKTANVELEKALQNGKVTNLDSAIKVGIGCLTTVLGTDLPSSEIEVGVVSVADDEFKLLSNEKIEEYLLQIEKEDE